IMSGTVDEVMLVSDDEIRNAMRYLFLDAGLVIEPAGAAGVAAIAKVASDWSGRRIAAILTGGNPTEAQVRDWRARAGGCHSATESESLTTMVPAARSPSLLPRPLTNRTTRPTPYA